MATVIKKPIPLRGLELSPEYVENLKLLENISQTLATIIGMTDNERIPLRCDDHGNLNTRLFNYTDCETDSAVLTSGVEKDWGSEYDYFEVFPYLSLGKLELGIATGVLLWVVYPVAISVGGYGTDTDMFTCVFRGYARFRFMEYTVLEGNPAAVTQASVFRFPKR